MIETGLAVCDACQRTFDADPKDVQKYGGIVRDLYSVFQSTLTVTRLFHGSVPAVTLLFFLAYLPWMIKDRKARKANASKTA